MTTWYPASWQQKTCLHYPDYPSSQEVAHVLTTLAAFPPLVDAVEIDALKKQLAMVAQGQAFLLQGGDCAESFAECQAPIVKRKIQLLAMLRSELQQRLNCPVVTVGRIAGQYAKPRSQPYETRTTEKLPSYRGDMINAITFTEAARTPNPHLMTQAYYCAASTLDILRQQTEQVFTSHEALLLPYEQTFTRQVSDKWYNLATHFPWIGYRTNQLDSAHVEYARGIHNPIAVKIGPETSVDLLQALVFSLNPNAEPGRLVIMTRLGANNVSRLLPAFIKSVAQTKIPVVWSCDPMHGNTRLTSTGIKTRYLEDIATELQQTQRIHQQCNSRLGGIHLELTAESVAECMGGACDFQEQDLQAAYTSLVDPRLNALQAMEIVRCIRLIISPVKA